MTIRRVAVIYDDRDRPETTGGYCWRALQELVEAIHFLPDAIDGLSPGDFDLFVHIDDGIQRSLRPDIRPLAWWAIDTHLDPDRCLAQAQNADLTFAAQKPGTEALRRSGIAAEWLPLACDPAVHHPHDVPKTYDVCFVGNIFPGPRAELLHLIRCNFPNSFVGRAYFDDMARAYSAARTAFNHSIRDDLNMRVFEALACGSMLLTNDLPTSGQPELFREGFHLASFRSSEELLDKLRFYLGRPEARARVEQAGRREVVERHTYRHRMERILSATGSLPRSVQIAADVPQNSSRPVAQYDPSYFEFDRPELLALIPPDAQDVVDVGCGAGRLGASLKARQSARVVGIEQNSHAAAAARSWLDLVVEGDAEHLDWPFPPASFDAVVCGDVLEHLRDPLAFLRKVRTWLRPAGVLVTSLPNIRHHSVVRGLLAGDWTYEPAGLLDHTHLRFFTRREIEKLLYRAGFDVPILRPVPGPGYPEWDAAGQPGEVSVGGLRIGPLSQAEAEEFYTYQWLAAAHVAKRRDYGMTSIVILTHNQLPYTRQCVDSIRLLTEEPYELVFVDNGSTDGTPGYLQSLAATDEHVQVILNPENRGFPAGANQGIRTATGQQILLLNNDTVVTTGWLGRLIQALHSAPDVGLAGPCSNHVSGEQCVETTYDDLGGLDGFAWERAKAHEGITEVTDRLVGFCLLVRREVIERVGLLDEEFGIGNFEDDDFCLRAARAGFRAVIARDVFVHHTGGVTFAVVGVDYADLMRRNSERFQAKWGNPAADRFGSTPPTVAPQPALGTAPTSHGASFTLRTNPAGGLLLERRDLLLSGCLIVRDNATTIRACLESLRRWVDELVVVDTGSRDETPRIAAELGSRVFHFPWCDDFSAARNESVRYARGRWIFWMDSDDTIDERNGRGLRELAAGRHRDGVLGYVVRVHCPGPGDSGQNDVIVVDHVKLFANRPDLRFDGRIHEQIIPAIRQAGGEVCWTELFVVHSGYDHSPEGQQRKKERDLRLLGLELAERPGHPFTLFNLGMTYDDIGHPAEAVKYLEESIRNSGSGDSHLRKAYALLANSLSRLGRRDEALGACERGLAEFPDDLELLFRRGGQLHEVGRLHEAIAAYRAILTTRGERYFTSVDPALAGYKARQNLAAVYADLADWPGAEEQWRAVLAEFPHYRQGWRGLGEVLLHQGKVSEAKALADRLRVNGRLRGEGCLLGGRIAANQNRPEEARRAWEAAADEDPSDPEPLRQLGRLHFETGSDGAAERVLRELIRLDPEDAAAHHNLGSVLLRRGRAREAADVFRRSLELRPGSVETRLCLGYALRAAGDRGGAATAWRAVLATDPGNKEAAEAIRTVR